MRKFNMERPKGIILVLQNGFSKISVDECISALPEDWKQLDREKIEVNYSEVLDPSKFYDYNFGQFALEHRRKFANEIKPLIDKKSDYVIAYFGLAPIPLSMDFGQLFHNYRNLKVYQLHHVTKKWYLNGTESPKENSIKITGLPEKDQKGISHALIRLSISHYVNPEETLEVMQNAAEVDIQLDKPNEDVIDSEEKMIEISEAVKSALDELSANRSELQEIHLFASIPNGLSFLIGTKISPTIHPYIQTYQYSRVENPKYKKALLVKSEIQIERKLTEEDKKNASALRALGDKELKERVNKFCTQNKLDSKGRSWLLGIIPEIKSSSMSEAFWSELPPISETTLCSDSIYLGADVIENGFRWRKDQWHIDDNFFVALRNRLQTEEDIKKALRLFLFHEALHYAKHDLTDITSVNIGSFPKVLEIADYQADVYAILNEFGFERKMNGEVANVKEFFLRTISVALETMWSFDDAGRPLSQIQIRRLNRYLNWYWQCARIEKSGNSLDEIIQILEEKPVIELNGLETKEEDNRFYFNLEKRTSAPLELGVFTKNKVIRAGSATNMLIENLITGTREMKGEKILEVIKSFLTR